MGFSLKSNFLYNSLMRIGYLGAGAWGFCLAHLLARKGYKTLSWTNKDLAEKLNDFHEHPNLPGVIPHENMRFTSSLDEAVEFGEILVESVTSKGVRPVFSQFKKKVDVPIILTSKGIEQNTGLTLPEVALEVLGEHSRNKIALLSGPSFANEVVRNLPTSVVASAFDPDVMVIAGETFTTDTFRVYPNNDPIGVAYGGALKNIIAIACGISEGMELGLSTRAAIITRGLHEIRKLAIARGCKAETINGLSGLGDVVLTSSSLISRNFRYGHLIAQGLTPEEARVQIGMVVEGAYTAVSALQLSEKLGIDLPITKIVYHIIYKDMKPKEAVKALMMRTIKEEHL